MVKAVGKCNLCNSNKFLNFAGLCKRCNRKPEASKFTAKALGDQMRHQKEKKELAQAEAAEAKKETGEGGEAEKEEGSE